MKKIYSAIAIFAGILSVQAQTPVKRVLLEEFTTSYCGFCPPASKQVHDWHESHPNSIMLTIHEGFGTDAMSSSFTNSFFSTYKPSGSSFAPAIMIDRAVYPWVDSSIVPYMSALSCGFDTIASRVMNTPAAVDVQIINGTYNSTTRQLKATVTAKFVSTVPPGDYRINLYLIEDSVTGTGANYDQKIYNSTWANTNYPTLFDGAEHIVGYPHRLVLRDALLKVPGSIAGTNGDVAIPKVTSPVIGTTYSATTATYIVPSTYNDKRLKVVATVARNNSGASMKYTLNAIEADVKATISSSIEENKNKIAINTIFPIPATDMVTLVYTTKKQDNVMVTVNNILGQVEKTVLNERSMLAGKHELQINTNELAKGVYYLTINTSDSQMTQKFIVQ
jgi:hypothetical protein